MFKRNRPSNTNMDLPGTIISQDVKMEAANMTGKESVRIDGSFNGNIDLDGSLVLSDTGKITGDVKVAYFLVAGRVKGNILCHEELRFTETAVVEGDVIAKTLIIDGGAQLSGKYTIFGSSPIPQDSPLSGGIDTNKPFTEEWMLKKEVGDEKRTE